MIYLSFNTNSTLRLKYAQNAMSLLTSAWKYVANSVELQISSVYLRGSSKLAAGGNKAAIVSGAGSVKQFLGVHFCRVNCNLFCLQIVDSHTCVVNVKSYLCISIVCCYCFFALFFVFNFMPLTL